AGDVGAVRCHGQVGPRVGHRVVIVLDEVPADQVVGARDPTGAAVVAVVVLVDAVGPSAQTVVATAGVLAHGLEEVATVDVAVVVEVGDLADALVARVVEVAEGDEAVAVDVEEVGAAAGRDLALVDPDVAVKVLVGVIDAGVHDGDGDASGAGGDVPG